MTTITPGELAKVQSFSALIDLLEQKLGWPINGFDLDDLVYEYDADELGLKPEETAKIREIHQLRPLATNQPWGIFFISFEDKALSVTVLRRILRSLVVKKRAGEQRADRQAWDKHDLIFAANFGKSGERELAFIHFSDGAASGDLPVMKVLGWNAKDTSLHNDYVGNTLAEKLRWPDDPSDTKAWQTTWASAFELRLNETIKTSKELAIRLAALATEIRARANQLLEAEAEDGPMRTMLAAFSTNLIQNLDEDGFADMFAQTICYGLLAASISRLSTDPDIVASGMTQPKLVADNIADMVPRTNPFLKELFGSFLKLGGRDKRTGLDFDELGVRDVVDMLNSANMPAVLRDFGDRNPKEDPVIHFYELFLKEYDPKKRMQRGVFYTPRPVVNFIVCSVDEILREEFGLPLGLADTTTWGELAAKNDKIAVPAHIDSDEPFVQILDPATGTGTFLVEVIDLVHKRMVTHWQAEGMRSKEIVSAWNEYVPAHLLPRLTAFELMMAPYAIAHMKVGLKLVETGYQFGSDERARIFLTNALEPAQDLGISFDFISEALAHEAKASNLSKATTPFTVLIGNPPYSLKSSNLSANSKALINKFRFVDGKRIKERGALQLEKNLQDDYVKFLSLAHGILDRNGAAIVGLITNHSYFSNPTLRGVRRCLLTASTSQIVLDLHGNTKNREAAPNGGANENVFDIQQGVGVSIFINGPSKSGLYFGDLWGARETKYEKLLNASVLSLVRSEPDPSAPQFAFKKAPSKQEAEYSAFLEFLGFFQVTSTGVATARDSFCVAFEAGDLVQRANNLLSWDTETSRKHYQLGKDTNDWAVELAKADLAKLSDIPSSIVEYSYRPLDVRHTIFTGKPRGFICNPRRPVMSNIVGLQNVAICLSKSVEGGRAYAHVFAVSRATDHHAVSLKEVNYVVPIWLKPAAGEKHNRPNLKPASARAFGNIFGLSYDEKISCGDLIRHFGPRDLFDWIYAILHAPSYRNRYEEFLKSDFPRIPTPRSLALFKELVPLGRQLVALHLLKAEEVPKLVDPSKFDPAITFNGSGEARIERGYPKYQNGKVMINSSRWFEDVPKATWDFHVGGYQVCDKWLKDRAAKGGKKPSPGRVLSDKDILHYRRIVVALTETCRLMAEIDKAIEKHGGWPEAFRSEKDNAG